MVKWVQVKESDLCKFCKEPAHTQGPCPKPPGMPVGKWQSMSDDERLDAERARAFKKNRR